MDNPTSCWKSLFKNLVLAFAIGLLAGSVFDHVDWSGARGASTTTSASAEFARSGAIRAAGL